MSTGDSWLCCFVEQMISMQFHRIFIGVLIVIQQFQQAHRYYMFCRKKYKQVNHRQRYRQKQCIPVSEHGAVTHRIVYGLTEQRCASLGARTQRLRCSYRYGRLYYNKLRGVHGLGRSTRSPLFSVDQSVAQCSIRSAMVCRSVQKHHGSYYVQCAPRIVSCTAGGGGPCG